MVNTLIFGCTGLVGKVLIDLIQSRKFPITHVTLVASSKSKGKILKIYNKEYKIIDAEESLTITNLDIIFFCSSSSLAKIYCPKYLENNTNCFIVDNSSHFRLDPNVDIIIPPVNQNLLHFGKRIISNSNCTTSGLIMAIFNLKEFDIKKLNIVSLQSVSGSGYNGLNQLLSERQDGICQNPVYDAQIYNNVIPLIGSLNDLNITTEEAKLVYETKKILNNDNIIISAMCTRIPTEFCHSLVVQITFQKEISIQDIKEKMNEQDDLIISDQMITPFEIKQKNEVFVYRLRKDEALENTFSMFITFNNLFRGASLNSIQIAEKLIEIYFN
jgi:aspartate-semialdehyde dehydrogenase